MTFSGAYSFQSLTAATIVLIISVLLITPPSAADPTPSTSVTHAVNVSSTEHPSEKPDKNTTATQPSQTIETVNCTTVANGTNNCNSTAADKPLSRDNNETKKTYFGIDVNDFEMYRRAFYVIVAVTTIVVLYLGVKTFIVRRRTRKAKKYGVLSDEHLQLTNADDDEEEDELFDQSRRRLITG